MLVKIGTRWVQHHDVKELVPQAGGSGYHVRLYDEHHHFHVDSKTPEADCLELAATINAAAEKERRRKC